MLKLGFEERWVNLVMECVTIVDNFVLNKNDEIGPIKPERGLRQGDPISPYLFIIVAEGFNSMIRSYEQMGKLHGIKVARNAPPISHLFFAGDSYIYFKANAQETSNLKHFLNDYSVASGQCINMDKSSLSYSRNVNDEVKETMEEIMGVKSSDGNGNYLGLPMIIGKNKKEILSFIKQRIVNHPYTRMES